jgi:glycosyltransferase involved in cell wall biosynthesis
MELASGYYLAFLDSDDRWRPTMLEKQAAMLSHDNSLVCCFTNFVRFVEGTGAVLADQFTFYPELASVRNECHQLGDGYIVDTDPFSVFVKFHDIPAYMQCTTFRRTLIADMRLNESLRRCEDTEFVLRAFMRGRVAFMPEILVEVRRHDLNITKNISLMELDKLRALLALRSAVDDSKRRDRLNDRIVKSGIDSATALIRAGRRSEGLACYLNVLRVPGSSARKIKGFARTSHSLLASMTGIAAHEAG